jgi:predicted acetylornithine/succinylornithine family transaminase
MSAVLTESSLENEISAEAVKALDAAHVMHTYARLPVVFTKGQGQWLWDTNGKRYLDFLGGIAVNAVGHCHPRVVAAIQHQAAELIHTSNIYYTAPQANLANNLCRISGLDRVFFCNSGAEANEAALKISRKHGRSISPNKTNFVTAHRSFHGRTMATVTATAQAKYQDPFRPLIPGFQYVNLNDADALRAVVDENTCAVLLEPLQGEAGVFAASSDYLKSAREICDEAGALLVFDEVQTGMGRTGDWWAHQNSGVTPDIMTSAKALGGGLPIGACMARGAAAEVFVPGDHGSTFAGNPLATTAALAVIETIETEGLLSNAAEVGDYFAHQIRTVLADDVLEVRGRGLIIGVQLRLPIAKKVLMESMDRGLIVNAVGDSILRFLPPLIITKGDVDQAISVLKEVTA